MDKNIGFIGFGVMAQAMTGGIISSKLIEAKNLIVSDPLENNLAIARNKFRINAVSDNIEVAKCSDILFLSVKPYKYSEVIDNIKAHVKDDVIIITIAAGIPIDFIQKAFNKAIKVVRTMPNTPALVGEGMSALCPSNMLTKEELQDVIKIFESFGKAEIIEEKLMDAIPAISGSSPAYVFMFIEALADGGVLSGIPRDKAYKLAAQAVLGAAKMVLETGEHPGVLKDRVCTPGGTTIEAVYTLEKNNFRGSIISAMESCTQKTINMSKGK